MKKLWLLLLVVLPACQTVTQTKTVTIQSTTNLAGSWTIVVQDASAGVVRATFAPSSCTVEAPAGEFSVQGPSCFLSESVTSSGTLFPVQSILIGTTENPAPNDSTVNFIVVEGNAVFGASGVVSNGTLSGQWGCPPEQPGCVGASGTFTATVNQ